jgi:hypothetical protein
VLREAIETRGYDYEETEFFYYILQYLRYVSLLLTSFWCITNNHTGRCLRTCPALRGHSPRTPGSHS